MGIESIIPSRWSIIPGRRSLTYYRRTGGTWATAVTVANAEKRNNSRTETGGDTGAAVTVVNCDYYVWKQFTSALSIVPKQGDKFTDSKTGETWIVESVLTEMMGERYKLSCVLAR